MNHLQGWTTVRESYSHWITECKLPSSLAKLFADIRVWLSDLHKSVTVTISPHPFVVTISDFYYIHNYKLSPRPPTCKRHLSTFVESPVHNLALAYQQTSSF